MSDPTFGVSANALRLNREVEIYQWKENKKSEKKKKLGGGTETVTTYTYEKVWSKNLTSSSSFKKAAEHQNPTSAAFEGSNIMAKKATIGAFSLTTALINKMADFEPVIPENVPAALKSKATIQENRYYIGNASSPQIGDMRISFKAVKPGPVSIVARQINNTFEPYISKNGGKIQLLKSGNHSADAMFEQAHKSNKMLTIGLRVLGFVLMFMGISAILKPLSVIADVVPLIGNIVEAGTGIIAFILGAVLSLVTIAIAWIVYRPVLGISLLLAAGGLVFAAKSKLKKTA